MRLLTHPPLIGIWILAVENHQNNLQLMGSTNHLLVVHPSKNLALVHRVQMPHRSVVAHLPDPSPQLKPNKVGSTKNPKSSSLVAQRLKKPINKCRASMKRTELSRLCARHRAREPTSEQNKWKPNKCLQEVSAISAKNPQSTRLQVRP